MEFDLTHYAKVIRRNIFKINPILRMVQLKIRRRNLQDIQAILKAEINVFKRLPLKQQQHIAIKILKVIDKW